MVLLESKISLKTGDSAPDFLLMGIDDKMHSLDSYSESKGLLIIFICNHCPYVKAKIDAIKQVLTSQQLCWNNGDIDGFMLGYWNSEKFKFSWVNGIEYGWKNALEKYKISYPTKESMGEFSFEILDVKLTSDTTAVLDGEWELIRKNDNPKGSFILIFQKIENNWLIISDYTTDG